MAKILKAIWFWKWPVLALVVAFYTITGINLWVHFVSVVLGVFAMIEFASLVIVLIILMVKKRKDKIKRCLLTMLGIIFYIMMVGSMADVAEKRTEETKEVGNLAISLIEEFKEKNGHYPKDENELPAAVKALKPKVFTDSSFWYYWDEERQYYRFGFLGVSARRCDYYSMKKTWGCRSD